MRKLFFLSLAAALLASCAGAPQDNVQKADEISAGEHTRVQTVYGTYEGYLDGVVYTFKGIKYADAERFMPPQDPAKFDGIRMAKLYGPKAPQRETLVWSGDTQRDYTFGNQFVYEPMDEKECLVLNVWTKGINDGGKRPVFIWIHGGGYSTGSGHDLDCYEGKALAEKGDIVVVNLNHRLNVLGYTNLSGLGGKYAESVNLGMQDIVKALEWVHKNIAKFGGDPASVTIGGQSGGGGKVSTLLAMPSAKGLFQKAIVQSGSTLTQQTGEAAQAFGLEFVKALGLKPGPNVDFSKFSYDELVAASNLASRTAREKGITGSGGAPCVDGKYLPTNPFNPGAPEVSRDVPMLIGTDFNEFEFDIRAARYQLSKAEVEAQVKSQRGEQAGQAYIDAFYKAYPEKEAKEMLYVDTRFRPGAVQQAALKSQQGGAKAYLYLFTWAPTNNALGASHGMELPFMFNNVANQREMTGSTREAYVFEQKVSDAWIAFIKTGDPNCASLPNWEPYNAETGPCMILDNVCELRYNHDKELIGGIPSSF